MDCFDYQKSEASFVRITGNWRGTAEQRLKMSRGLSQGSLSAEEMMTNLGSVAVERAIEKYQSS